MSDPSVGLPLAPHPAFEVLGVLGHGGVATVYRVRQPGTDALLAWKVWHEPFDEQTRARFDAECTLHTALSEHPHIARLIDRAHPASGQRPWIATELYEQSLQDWLQGQQPTAPQWRTLAADLLSGLAAVHAAGHVHRDVKPANILLRAGRWALTDLGLAMPIDGHTRNAPAGTPFFIAPELGRPNALPTPRSDVYSAALTLLLAIEQLRDPESFPGEVDALLTRCASVHPADRLADARGMRERLLAAWASHHPLPQSPPARAEDGSTAARPWPGRSPVTTGPATTGPATTGPATTGKRREVRLTGLAGVLAACLLLAGSTDATSRHGSADTTRIATPASTASADDAGDGEPDRSSTQPPATAAPECAPMPTQDAVNASDRPGLLSVSHLGYSVHSHLSVEVSGRIDPSLSAAPAGTLWLVSFPQRLPVGSDGRPGSELWYPLGALRPEADGCFTTTALQLSSYDGARNIIFHMALAQLSPQRRQQAEGWLAGNSADGWRPLPDDVQLLGTFDVDSAPFETL